MLEEAPIDSQRHCRQQLCCWFSWGQNLQTFPKENSIQNSKQTVTEYNCHTKSQSKNPSKTKETTSLAETLVPTSKLCEVWASEIRVFGGHTNFQFENSLLCVSNCGSVFYAFSCIWMHFALQNSWFSHAVLHSPWIAQILHKGSRFL